MRFKLKQITSKQIQPCETKSFQGTHPWFEEIWRNDFYSSRCLYRRESIENSHALHQRRKSRPADVNKIDVHTLRRSSHSRSFVALKQMLTLDWFFDPSVICILSSNFSSSFPANAVLLTALDNSEYKVVGMHSVLKPLHHTFGRKRIKSTRSSVPSLAHLIIRSWAHRKQVYFYELNASNSYYFNP